MEDKMRLVIAEFDSKKVLIDRKITIKEGIELQFPVKPESIRICFTDEKTVVLLLKS